MVDFEREMIEGVEDLTAPPLRSDLLAPEEAKKILPDLAPLIDWWVALRGTNNIPDWSQVNFADFRGWHSRIILSKFLDRSCDPFFILTGDEVLIKIRHNPKGKFLSQCMPRQFGVSAAKHFEALRKTGCIGLTYGPSPHMGRAHVNVCILELPFRDGGEQVERLVHLFSSPETLPEISGNS